MGDKIGRSTLFGIPLQQEWSYENSGDFAPTYYLQSDAPLYYYSFTDAYIARVTSRLPPEQQARLDPDDHRLQSGRHVRRRSHPPRARALSRRIQRHRRVLDPQGVRVGQDRRGAGQPHRSRARPDPRFRWRGRSGRDPALRHRHALCQGGHRTGLPAADEGAAAAPLQHDDHLGAHRPGPCRPSDPGAGQRGRKRGAEPGLP